MFGLFKSKPEAVPSAAAEPERYTGRPLLILMENYVLDCIGELTADMANSSGEAVRKVFGGGSDWKATLREKLQLESSLDDNMRHLWTRNQDIAKQNGVELHPVQFAKMIADTNFAHLIQKD